MICLIPTTGRIKGVTAEFMTDFYFRSLNVGGR